jgi:hypothetical protein
MIISALLFGLDIKMIIAKFLERDLIEVLAL